MRLRGMLCQLLALALFAGSLSPAGSAAAQGVPYPLDGIPRVLAPGESLPCKKGPVPLVHYSGQHLHYQKPIQVHPSFRGPLAAFELLVAEVATRFYGRAPSQVVHIGGYNCREMRRYPDWVSEHALGNAIDIAGFDFAPLKRKDPRFGSVAANLRGGLRVRIDTDWKARSARRTHAAFLHVLTRELAARPDIFRVVLGPGYPGHDNHLHLDFAPYRVVEFEAGDDAAAR